MQPVVFFTSSVAVAVAVAACSRSPGIVAEPDEPPARLAWEPFSPPRAAMASMVHEIERTPPSECEPGQRISCVAPGGLGIDGRGGPWMRCRQDFDGAFRFHRAECNTPLVLSFDGAPIQFTEAPGTFRIGVSARTEWVAAETPWLVLDADGSGCVESERELFGADETASNGFEKLARLDDNHDGRIDALDGAFARLALWYDRNQDRACTPAEIVPVTEEGIVAIDLAYVTPPRPARLGSFEGERATFEMSDGRRRRVVDVYLDPRP